MPSISEIQARLVELGYHLGTTGLLHDGVDGDWGDLSRAALAEFQRMHGLVPTGSVDPQTVSALFGAQPQDVPPPVFEVPTATSASDQPAIPDPADDLMSMAEMVLGRMKM